MLLLLIQPIVSAASINDQLNNMFNEWGTRSNTSPPNVFEAQTRGFAIGGALSARLPQRSITPFTIKEPYIKAGCGGLDIFGGSFSFINADQFVQYLQAIGQNALGYAFSLGLEAVCPPCNATIKTLRNFMNQMNKMFSDSCTAARALVNQATTLVSDDNLNKCISGKAKDGVGDHVDAWIQCSAGSESEVRQKIKNFFTQDTATKDADKVAGAERGSQTYQALRWRGLDPSEKELIMSVFGTWYTDSDNNTTMCKYRKPTLKLEDLIIGGEVKTITCGAIQTESGICEDISESTQNITGYKALVQQKMMDIMNRVKTNTQLTDDDIAFINSTPAPPILNMIQTSLRHSEDLTQALIDLTSEIVAVSYAWYLIMDYAKILEEGMHQTAVCSLGKDQSLAIVIKTVKEENNMLYQRYLNLFNQQTMVIQFIASLEARIAALSSDKLGRALKFKVAG